MTLDDELVEAVDKISKILHTNRSAFTRKALRDALDKFKVQQMEDKHKKGYEKFPVANEEFSVWEDEQAWGEE